MFDKRYELSLYEQVYAAMNILKGLKALHKQAIVHRDLGARNYLIHIPKGKPAKRKLKQHQPDQRQFKRGQSAKRQLAGSQTQSR